VIKVGTFPSHTCFILWITAGVQVFKLLPQLFNPSMKRAILLMLLIVSSLSSFSQRAQTIMIAAHADLIRSDNDGFFEKARGGIEANYFFSRKFSGTAGVEWWSADRVSMLLGARLRPIDEAFLRIRGLIGEDFSVGGGFARPIENFRIEAMADFYFSGQLAIRAGLAYVITRKRTSGQ
jgi:hypothetical protein